MNMSKYKFYHYTDKKDGKNVISAVSTYAGRTVKGYAKCDPRDTFSEENGQKLAAARCNANVAEKRLKRAAAKVKEAQLQLAHAQAYAARMQDYYNGALAANIAAQENVAVIVENL